MWHASKLEPPFSSWIASISKSPIKHCQTVCFRGFSFCDTWSISWHYWMSDKSLNYGRTALAAASPECQFCSCLGAGQMFQDNLVPAQYGRNWRSQLPRKCVFLLTHSTVPAVWHTFLSESSNEHLKIWKVLDTSGFWLNPQAHVNDISASTILKAQASGVLLYLVSQYT